MSQVSQVYTPTHTITSPYIFRDRLLYCINQTSSYCENIRNADIGTDNIVVNELYTIHKNMVTSYKKLKYAFYECAVNPITFHCILSTSNFIKNSFDIFIVKYNILFNSLTHQQKQKISVNSHIYLPNRPLCTKLDTYGPEML